MKSMIKGLISALQKYRSVYRPLNQSSKKSLSQNIRDSGQNKGNKAGLSNYLIGIAVLPGLAYFVYQLYQLNDIQENIIVHKVDKELKQVSNVTEREVGIFKEGLPVYSMEEISKHTSMESRLWVTYKQGVYDITDYVRFHPGGRQILKAGGTSLEPFWKTYAVHQKEEVYTLVEEFRIGNLK